jgi:hypothetical protein
MLSVRCARQPLRSWQVQSDHRYDFVILTMVMA